MKKLIYALFLFSMMAQSQSLVLFDRLRQQQVGVVDAVSGQLAFPEAKGAGGYTTGGRGGQVIYVNTLDFDASGGLQEALETEGERFIVFSLSGKIVCPDLYQINPEYGNVTIAGQTAPEGGITLDTGYFAWASVDNVIMQNIRVRNREVILEGQTEPLSTSAMWFQGGNDIVIDHCTFSHGNDEGLDFSYSQGTSGNVTIQSCFFQDNAKGGIVGIDSSGEVSPLPDLGDFTVVDNLFSNVSHRFMNTQGNGRVDNHNNVVYNFNPRLTRTTNSAKINITNNYYKPSDEGLRRTGYYPGSTVIPSLNKSQLQIGDDLLIYTAGNIITGQRETPLSDDSDMWTLFTGTDISIGDVGDPVPFEYFTPTPFSQLGVPYTIKTANQAYIDVLSDVGANKYLNADGTFGTYYDTKDSADLLMVENDTWESASGVDFVYVAPHSVPYPAVVENTRSGSYDTDLDGMADVWEIANGLNPSIDDSADDADDDGYTNIEEFLNGTNPGVVLNILDFPKSIYQYLDKYCEITDTSGRILYTGILSDFPKNSGHYFINFGSVQKQVWIN